MSGDDVPHVAQNVGAALVIGAPSDILADRVHVTADGPRSRIGRGRRRSLRRPSFAVGM